MVNLMGGCGLELLWALSKPVPLPAPTAPLIFVGFFGASTTFPPYGLESFNLLRDGELGPGMLNLLGSSLAGLLCVAPGFLTARLLLPLGGLP